MFRTSHYFIVNHVPRWVSVITTAALVSVFAGSAAAASARPTAHPGLGQAIAEAGPACKSWSAQPSNVMLGSLNLAGGAAARACRAGIAGWLPSRGELSPKSMSSAGLEGVFCTSAASCWAVGYFERNGAWLNNALRWNGHRWSRVAAPSPGGTVIGDTSELFGGHCTSAKNCWAVGSYERHGVQFEEAIHWNGKKWSLVATPTPGGTLSGDFNELFDVVCNSPDSCWASGEYGTVGTTGMEVIENQALHWNGKAWSQVTTPNPGGTGPEDANALSDIRCPTARNCWAVGTFGIFTGGGGLFNEALHWNGNKWSQVGVPDPGGIESGDFNELEGLSCTSPTSCWATGSDGTSGSAAVTLNQAVHWNGHTWSSVSVPQPDGTAAFAGNSLTGVNCSSPGNCWAVGYVGNFDLVAPILNEALHWNGTHWSMASIPDPAGSADDDHSTLYGIRCTSRTNCWAVGQAQPSGESDRSQLVHWNGVRWSAA